jgi:cysteinyl-tRNA synthetase
VLGLDLEVDAATATADAAPFIDLLLRVREELRQRREWALSDLIRDELGKLEVAVEDTATGATWTQRRG